MGVVVLVVVYLLRVLVRVLVVVVGGGGKEEDEDTLDEVVRLRPGLAPTARVWAWYWWWRDEGEEVVRLRPVQLRRFRMEMGAAASGAVRDEVEGDWLRVCMEMLRRCRRRPVDGFVVPGAVRADDATVGRLPRAGALGLGEADPPPLVLPLAGRALRGETPAPYWWCRAPDDGARGLGRRWWWSARVGLWSLCRTADGTPLGWGMWIIKPLAAKSSVPGGAGYSKLC
jgi:hypothetical protein